MADWLTLMNSGDSMNKIFTIAFRNLRRYKRRTFLTSSLIMLGVLSVLLFTSVTGSFKSMMVGEITDAMLGHIQVHQKGFMASIDTLPLNRNLKENQVDKLVDILNSERSVEAFSPRLRFGAMFSNYSETSNIRLNGIDPDKETIVVPLLANRISGRESGFLDRGEILVPELLAKGMKVAVGDSVVLVATNKDGSVNGQNFIVGGFVEKLTGPGGRDGYIHIEDARSLLRMEKNEVSEVAIRLNDMELLDKTAAALTQQLDTMRNKQDNPIFEIHTWQKLTPFSTIVKMIDLMTFFIKLMLIAIVLVSIMNVMVMAVYERINEIGTIAAIGTGPGKILALFLSEGLLLGIIGTVFGIIVYLVIVVFLNLSPVSYDFGNQKGLILSPAVSVTEIVSISLIVVAISVLGSLQPAWKAAKMDPITALRHV